MTDYQGLSESEKKRLDRYMQRCEARLYHLTPGMRSEVLLDIQQQLLAQITPIQTLSSLLLKNRQLDALLNPLLQSKNLPKIPKKKLSALKVMLLLFLFLIGIVAASIYWGMNKAMNWLEQSSDVSFQSEEIQIDNGKLRFAVNLEDFPGHSSEQLKNIQRGNVELQLNDSLKLEIDSGVTYIVQAESFSFECKTDQENYNPLKLTQGELNLHLKGKNQCQINIPPSLPLSVVQKTGVIKITGLEQNFSVTLDTGTVYWESIRPESFEVDSQVKGLFLNSAPFAPKGQGQFKALLRVHNGVLKLK